MFLQSAGSSWEMEPLEKQNDDVKKEEIGLVVGLSSLEFTHPWLPQFVVSLAVIRGSGKFTQTYHCHIPIFEGNKVSSSS